MNGSGSNDNHTLSPKQANALMDEIDRTTIKFIENLYGYTESFLVKLGRIWADENAAYFAKKIVSSANNIGLVTSNHINTVKDYICDICNGYALAGGKKNNVSATHRTFQINTDMANYVKETFDGDRYGFADGNSLKQIYGLLEELKKCYQKCGEEFIDAAHRTNAFGASGVKASLAIAVKRVNESITSHISTFNRSATDQINTAKERYANVSSSIGDPNVTASGTGFYGEYGSSNSIYASTGDVELTLPQAVNPSSTLLAQKQQAILKTKE